MGFEPNSPLGDKAGCSHSCAGGSTPPKTNPAAKTDEMFPPHGLERTAVVLPFDWSSRPKGAEREVEGSAVSPVLHDVKLVGDLLDSQRIGAGGTTTFTRPVDTS